MRFPDRWINWIKVCIGRVSFALLINRTPTSWFSNSRGIIQGDPISPYLFILVAQNLTSMLNFAMNHDMIPGFNLCLRKFFNHLMYADDLILITQASRKITTNINLCLSIYGNLTGQKVNKSKSEIIFPSRMNKRLRDNIARILGCKVGTFPINYLGILISPRKLALSYFSSLVNKIEKSVTFWKKSRISTAGKTILINSNIMSTPIYYLSAYPVPDTILNRISKAAMDLFWSKDCNRKGIHLVGWTEMTLNRSEGGLSVRDLGLSKISLMAKNVFFMLNNNDVWWVDIMNHKYGKFNIWVDNVPANCSWFYGGLYCNAKHLRPFLWINTINPDLTSFMYDPSYFELPLSHKPTYLNMNLEIENLKIEHLLVGNNWNMNELNLTFGPYINDNIIGNSHITYTQGNNWIWFPKSKGTKLFVMVYSHFNQAKNVQDHWNGWNKIWHLRVAPRVKHFLWLMFHNAVKTKEYLYKLKLGPQDSCSLCNLTTETIEHLFLGCGKIQKIWNNIRLIIRKSIVFPEGISFGYWLIQDLSGNDLFTCLVITATVWFI